MTDGRTSSEPDEVFGRRRLDAREREELLALPLPGVFSTVAATGWVHSVPVHFFHVHGEIRLVAERDAVKTRNVHRTGRATLCVVADVGSERRYVTVEGPVRVEDRISQIDLTALDQRYGYDSGSADDEEYAGSITLVLRPERWIGWADAD
jgi:general stress protein 26